MELILNRVHCNHCNTTITSRHRHDFIGCDCIEEDKKIFIDGGLEDGRLLFGLNSDYDHLSIYNDNNHNTIRENLEWGVNYDKEQNKLPKTIYKPIKDLNTDHIEAILEGNYSRGFYKKAFEDELMYRTNINPQMK
jgi:hypothetical protein